MNSDDLIRAIGIDLGGSAIKSGLVSRDGSINVESGFGLQFIVHDNNH